MKIYNNSRGEATKEKIFKALMYLLGHKSFNEIYVKDICTIACINRSSFYEHYQDINDLMMKIEENFSKQIALMFLDPSQYNKDAFLKLFKFLKENADFYRAFLTNHEGSLMDVNDFKAYIPKTIKNSNIKQDYKENEIIYHMAFFAAGLSAMCKVWFETDMKETPEEMVQIVTNEYEKKIKFF